MKRHFFIAGLVPLDSTGKQVARLAATATVVGGRCPR